MFLGIRAKSKRTAIVKVDYVIHIQEIKPWPPSNSLKSLRSIVLQWENGDHSTGFTDTIVPPTEDGIFEFNKSFKLQVTLVKGVPVKGSSTEVFHKNILALNLYEPRNKTLKGHHIGSATIDLAEHGVIKEDLDINVPINFRKSYKNILQPDLLVKIKPLEKDRSRSSKGSPSKEVSAEKDGRDSVSELTSEVYSEEAVIAPFIDDEDDLSCSSLDNSASAPETNVSLPQRGSDEQLHPKSQSSSHSSSADCDHRNCVGVYSSSDSPKQKHAIHSSLSSVTSRSSEEQFLDCNTGSRDFGSQDFRHLIETGCATTNVSSITKSTEIDTEMEEDISLFRKGGKRSEEVSSRGKRNIHHLHEKDEVNGVVEKREEMTYIQNYSVDTKSSYKNSPNDSSLTVTSQRHRNLRSAVRKSMISNTLTRIIPDERANNSSGCDRVKHAKSVRSSPDRVNNNVQTSNKLVIRDSKEIDVQVANVNDNEQFARETVMYDHTNSNTISGVNHVFPNKIQELELRVKKLQEELMETAVVESALYAIVAEHASSTHRVHTPARRLSRLYFHAYKNWSPQRKANAVKSATSGLILAAKACGNDIPRLTFWLSNTAMFRAIISLSIGSTNVLTSDITNGKSNGVNIGSDRNKLALKWKSSREKRFSLIEDFNFNDWEDPETAIEALEKIEAWMFSRITDSVWWQILTPYMHSAKENDWLNMKLNSNTSGGRSQRTCTWQQSDLSLDIWKRAFKEACGRLCPIRAAGHDCGCLPMLSRLVMEQCVARLDVAIFNAILRESEDDIPSNPVSDPISNLKVLPIPAGKKSFGGGVQLKSTVGNWSRYLSDLFDIDDSPENEKMRDDGQDCSASLMPFSILNSLSDLLMLPKEMLIDSSVRKQVCPNFSGPTIKQILDGFVPDEFCPDPIPVMVLEALEAEDPTAEKELAGSFPFDAAQVMYSPPSVASIVGAVGDVERLTLMRRSGSSVICKCHTSDDELDELASPFSMLISDKSVTDASKPKEMDPNVARYKLLREIWSDDLMLDI